MHINHYITQTAMKNIHFLTLIFFLSFSTKIFCQSVTLSQDSRFEQLLNEKRKINASITVNDRFKIQIFNGDAENSKKALTDFKKSNSEYDATIVFYTPIYKVWVGNFKTRIEAERNLNILKRIYPNAFLIKPNR